MQRQLSIFPLSIVLFPGAVIPLHIFEPRYRKMLADCLATDERFGLSFCEDEQPPLGSIGTVARIRQVERLADGRSNITVEGESRYQLVRWLEVDEPYLAAEVTAVVDAPELADDVAPVHRDALREFEALTTLLAQLAGTAFPGVQIVEDPGGFSFQLCGALELDVDVKQALLAETSTRARLAELTRRMRAAHERLKAGIAVQTRARRNGKSSHRPQLGKANS